MKHKFTIVQVLRTERRIEVEVEGETFEDAYDRLSEMESPSNDAEWDSNTTIVSERIET